MDTHGDSPQSAAASATPVEPMPEHITHNIDSIVRFHQQEEGRMSDSDRRLQFVGRLVGRPGYLLSVIGLVVIWVTLNLLPARLGGPRFDPPPFFWLQGLLTLSAVLTTIVILITQNRQSRFEARRLNLDLQVNLLTEQKTTKLIHLIEELRRDLPMVKDRHDEVANALQTPTDPVKMLKALDVHQDAADPPASPLP